VDLLGLVLAVVVSEANLNDWLGALAGLMELAVGDEALLERLEVLWVDQAY
jgi:hypothetical protein